MNIDQTDPGLSKFIIDDSNYTSFAQEVTDPNSPFSGGFDSDKVQAGFASPFSRSIIPRSQWKSLIEFHEENRSSPDHWRLHGKAPITDQNGFGYCWMYGTVGAINTAYTQTGINGLRLNPFYPAWMGKNGRNQGGWGGEAIEYINKWGIPEESVWPPQDHTGGRSKNHEVELNAKIHDVINYEELERNNFDALVSALLDPERPTPVTMGLQWWGHLIYASKVVEISSGKFGVKIVNSWKKSWGQDGCGVLAENKAKAFEQIAIVGVKPRVAV